MPERRVRGHPCNMRQPERHVPLAEPAPKPHGTVHCRPDVVCKSNAHLLIRRLLDSHG
jgi:hypothetical protein